MKKLQDILYGVSILSVNGSTNQSVSAVEIDSRKIQDKALFVAIRGETQDGHQYINQAINKGATVIVCENLPEKLDEEITYLQVKDARKEVAVMAANFHDHPSKKLKLIGVTGTNGKTTIVTLAHQLFTNLGVKVGMLSTIENKIGDKALSSSLTTPDALTINKLLQEMVMQNCEVVFMEVSSHAVEQKRVVELNFSGGVFTNISRDHLDYHKTFKDYIRAKQKFFDALPANAFALFNADDKNGEIMVQNTVAQKISYGLKSLANYKVKILENTMEGLLLNMDGIDFYTKLTGNFNALNLLAVYVIATQLGYDKMKVLAGLSSVKGAEGRLEKVVSENNIVAVVDYAHTPDALEKVLQTINDTRSGQEELITVVGCGGNRDKGKRPLMARIAAEYSTKVILTSDNPRDEVPSQIIEEMAEGVKISQKSKVNSITDRRNAIQTAVHMAETGDIILVAGKGHEKYQEIKGERFPFDDKQVLQEAFAEFGNKEEQKPC